MRALHQRWVGAGRRRLARSPTSAGRCRRRGQVMVPSSSAAVGSWPTTTTAPPASMPSSAASRRCSLACAFPSPACSCRPSPSPGEHEDDTDIGGCLAPSLRQCQPNVSEQRREVRPLQRDCTGCGDADAPARYGTQWELLGVGRHAQAMRQHDGLQRVNERYPGMSAVGSLALQEEHGVALVVIGPDRRLDVQLCCRRHRHRLRMELFDAGATRPVAQFGTGLSATRQTSKFAVRPPRCLDTARSDAIEMNTAARSASLRGRGRGRGW